MWRCDVSHQSSCPDSWVSTKNSNVLTFAWTSKKMLLMTPAFFRMSLRGTKPGFTPTTQKPKLNPVNGKVRGHLNHRRQGKWEATSSQCWSVSLIRRELFTKNLFLLVKQLMLHSTSKFWNVYGWMCEGNDLISGGTTHGCSTMTMRQPMLPSWLDGFWPITTWLWCLILPTRPTLHPATFSYFQNWKWSLRGEDFSWRKFKQSHSPSWTCYEKMTSRNASKTGSTAGIVVKPQKGTTLKVMPAPNV